MPGILGIDPGTTGALALFDPTKSAASGLRWIVADLPVIVIEPKRKGGNRQTKLNVGAFRDWLRKHAPDRAYLEAMMFAAPGKGGGEKGLAGAMRYGSLHGAIEATLLCCDVPVELVQPLSWKRYSGLMKSDKERSRLKALQLFPDQSATLELKKHQNRAEAMLIVRYADSLQSGAFA